MSTFPEKTLSFADMNRAIPYEDVLERLPQIVGLPEGEKLVKLPGWKEGSINKVYRYSNSDNTKQYVVRIERETIFTNILAETASPKEEEDEDKIEEKKIEDISAHDAKAIREEFILSKYNWEKASELGLSPRLYFYGYVTQGQPIGTTQRWYLCIISDAYTTDLDAFYRPRSERWGGRVGSYRRGKALNDVDLKIRSQLSELLIKVSTEMGLICFDLKPLNCVIKYENNKNEQGRSISGSINIDSIDVKLIDWDSDWCNKKYMFQANPTNAVLAGWISQIVMANMFYDRVKWNIFSLYFKQLHELKTNTYLGVDQAKLDSWRMATSSANNSSNSTVTKLSTIFCQDENRGNYLTMVNHYLDANIPNKDGRMCYTYFNTTFMRNSTLLYGSTRPASLPAAVLSSKSSNGGGGMRKKLLRSRRKKKKTQHKHKRKKQRKTNKKH